MRSLAKCPEISEIASLASSSHVTCATLSRVTCAEGTTTMSLGEEDRKSEGGGRMGGEGEKGEASVPLHPLPSGY